MHEFVQTSLSTYPRPDARVAVLVLGEVSEKMIEADGLSTKINFGSAMIRDILKLVGFNSNFTRSTDHTDNGRIPNEHGVALADRGRQAPTAGVGMGSLPSDHGGRNGRGSNNVRDVVLD